MQARLAALGAVALLLFSVGPALAGHAHRNGAAALRDASAGTWLAAVDVVGRIYGPAIASWELSCSKQGSEGGWGAWVSNSRGSGAGGWLQFMKGTFDGVIAKAIADARARGWSVPASASSWYSPVGQALAGVEMLREGRRGEWSGYGC